MFITTANQLEPIPPALRDRMEAIQLAGYTEEKLEIAKRYLVARQIERNSLDPEKIEFTEEALEEIAEGYAQARRAQPRAGDRRGVPEDRASPGAGAARGGA